MPSTREQDGADELLMRRYQQGDVSAFAQLVERHLSRVYNFIAGYLGKSEAAKDLTQEVFLRVSEQAKDFKHQARFATWLYTLARGLCVDHLRKVVFQKPSSGDDQVAEREAHCFAEHPSEEPSGISGERAAASPELGARIAAALYGLPEDQREVFLLHEVAKLAFCEIAVVTGVPQNAIKSRMRYALERLQQELVLGSVNLGELPTRGERSEKVIKVM